MHSFAFFPRRPWLVSVSWDAANSTAELIFWDYGNGQRFPDVTEVIKPALAQPTLQIAVRGDEDQIALGGPDKLVRLWKAEGTKGVVNWVPQLPVQPPPNIDGPVNGIAFRPRSKQLAIGWGTAEQAYLGLWSMQDDSAATPGPRFLGHAGLLRGMSFSNDGIWLATACEDGLWILNAEPASQIRELKNGVHFDKVAYSADQKRKAALQPDGKTIALEDVATAIPLIELRLRDVPGAEDLQGCAVAFAPDNDEVWVQLTDGRMAAFRGRLRKDN